jgi:hypothetical protein
VSVTYTPHLQEVDAMKKLLTAAVFALTVSLGVAMPAQAAHHVPCDTKVKRCPGPRHPKTGTATPDVRRFRPALRHFHPEVQHRV